MRSLLSSLAAIVLALSSIAQTPAPQKEQSDPKEPPPCTVSGRVIAAAEGAPIKSARVALVQENVKPRPRVFAATTDNDGRFEIKKVAPDRYHFFASRTGYISQQYQAKGNNGGAVLALVPGQEVTDALFRLVRAAVVTGRVIDESGESMIHVAVTTLRKPSAEENEDAGRAPNKVQLVSSAVTQTDDRGEYRMFGLKPGEYYLRAAEPTDMFAFLGFSGEEDPLDSVVQRNLGSQYAPVFYPGVLQLDQAQVLSLSAGEEMQADFAMRHVKTVEVSGKVIGADGKPPSHAFVLLSLPGVETWSDELGTSADAKGEFAIKGVPPGSYVLSAHMFDDNKQYSARQKLEVGSGSVESLIITFGRGTAINGRIIAAGAGANALDRIHIKLESTGEDDDEGNWAAVKKDGSFQIDDVSDGSFALQIGGMEQGWYVKSAQMGAEDVLQKGVQLEKGSSSGTLEITLSSAGAQLDGSVTDHDKPVVGAQVRMKPEPETAYNRMRSKSTNTDQNGHFTFNAVPPGKYRVTARQRSAASDVPPIASAATIVTLDEHDQQALQLTLASPQNE